jgi:hypothetical protein
LLLIWFPAYRNPIFPFVIPFASRLEAQRLLQESQGVGLSMFDRRKIEYQRGLKRNGIEAMHSTIKKTEERIRNEKSTSAVWIRGSYEDWRGTAGPGRRGYLVGSWQERGRACSGTAEEKAKHHHDHGG